MPPRPILLRVETAIVHPCVARPGDVLIIRPGDPSPVVLHRDVAANYGALLGHLAAGALTPLDDRDDAFAVLLAAQRLAPRPPAPPVLARRREA